MFLELFEDDWLSLSVDTLMFMLRLMLMFILEMKIWLSFASMASRGRFAKLSSSATSSSSPKLSLWLGEVLLLGRLSGDKADSGREYFETPSGAVG